MFIDTHCHISSSDYDDIGQVIKEAVDAGVSSLVVSGCSLDDIDEVVSLSELYDEVVVTLGYHPECVEKVSDSDIVRLEEILKSCKKVVGVGEIGLDYHYSRDNKEEQEKLFRMQLDIAERLNLPVVIHSRDAVSDTIRILKDYDVSGIIHCFGGSLETANIYIKMGYKLGIGGVVTFKNSKLSDVLEQISLCDIVLETDSPYLAPVPYRGCVNSSRNIPIIAEKIASIYDVDVLEVARVTTNNAKEIFKI